MPRGRRSEDARQDAGGALHVDGVFRKALFEELFLLVHLEHQHHHQRGQAVRRDRIGQPLSAQPAMKAMSEVYIGWRMKR